MLFAQADQSLHFEGFFPAAGANITIAGLDLGVDVPAFSDMWRKAFLRIEWPALPNHVNSALNIVVTLLDSADAGATYQSGAAVITDYQFPTILPAITVSIPGVAVTGAPASQSDVPLPPGLRGPIAVLVVVPAGVGDCTGALFLFRLNPVKNHLNPQKIYDRRQISQ